MDLPGSFITCPTFANSGTRIQPDGTHTANGFAVNEYLPAEYFNWLEWAVTANLNQIITNTMTELDGVLTQAGVSPVSGTNTQFASCFTTSATAYKYVQRDLNGNSQFSSLSMTTTGVGIKRTVATDPLEVSGVISIWNGSTKGLYGYTTLFGDAVLGNASNYNLIFSRNNLEKARIDTNDYFLLGYTTSQGAYNLQVNGGAIFNSNVGIGTTNPLSTLSIVKTTADRNRLHITNTSSTGSASSAITFFQGRAEGITPSWELGSDYELNGTNSLYFHNGSLVMYMSSTGNVGIGRTPTTYTLEINGTVWSNGGFRSTTTNGSIDIADGGPGFSNHIHMTTGVNGKYIRVDSGNNLSIINAAFSAQILRLDDIGDLLVSGNVYPGNNTTYLTGNATGIGVGRIATTYAFEVQGDSYATGALRSGGNVYPGNAASYLTGNATGIGVGRAATTYAFEVAGDIYATGTLRPTLSVISSSGSIVWNSLDTQLNIYNSITSHLSPDGVLRIAGGSWGGTSHIYAISWNGTTISFYHYDATHLEGTINTITASASSMGTDGAIVF